MKNKRDYLDTIHTAGRIWMVVALQIMIMIPAAISIYYDAWPIFSIFMIGFIGIAPTFWTVGIIETFTYVPMLGAGGSYLAFVTGNLTNLKVPCAVNAMDTAKVKPGTEEGDVISTIAIAVSSIVTVLIITVGVFMLAQIRPLLEAPALEPAFANILPALFGALGIALISRNWKVALPPIVFMLALFLLIPALAGVGPVLVPVGVMVAIGAARLMYKRGWLG
jgi:hypothetical protein